MYKGDDMKVIYIADDGTQFYDEYDCRDYEWKLNHPHLNDIIFYDKDNNELKEIFLEDIYCKTEKVVVPNEEAVKTLYEFAMHTGFCCYFDITEVGMWIFNEEEGKFVRL